MNELAQAFERYDAAIEEANAVVLIHKLEQIESLEAQTALSDLLEARRLYHEQLHKMGVLDLPSSS